jgi:hypothetical protein
VVKCAGWLKGASITWGFRVYRSMLRGYGLLSGNFDIIGWMFWTTILPVSGEKLDNPCRERVDVRLVFSFGKEFLETYFLGLH